MAIIERPTETPEFIAPAPTASGNYGYLRRPVETEGWRSWAFTVDHKKIGIMYGAVAMFFFIVGGLEAGLIRLQLAGPDGTILSADKYNQMFTMHATTMVFLFVMPMAAAFANYFIPLQIGARDVAFPRLNALSLWIFVFGGIFLNTSWLLGGGADGGWFMYAPNSSVPFSPSNGVDFWGLGLQIVGIASLVGAINHHDGAQHACTGDVDDEDADLHLDGLRHPDAPALRHPGHHRCALPPDVPAFLRRHVLQRRGWC